MTSLVGVRLDLRAVYSPRRVATPAPRLDGWITLTALTHATPPRAGNLGTSTPSDTVILPSMTATSTFRPAVTGVRDRGRLERAESDASWSRPHRDRDFLATPTERPLEQTCAAATRCV
jgi:hypothetical protein